MTTNHIRVFISSTFKDMQDERDILVKKVFPRLRVEAEKRGLTFSYVDLRWGVVPNPKPREIIDVCLSEIENCDPFFIGLIGHNYGSLIPSIDQSEKYVLDGRHNNEVNELLQKELGYTELEMRYNYLLSKDREHNFFYIKEEAPISPKSSNRGCLTTFIPDTLLSLKNNSGKHNCLLENLKTFVRSNYPETTKDYPADTTYGKSKPFEEIVISDFMKIIGDYEVPQHLGNKSVRYNQESFLEKQKDLIPRIELLNQLGKWVYQHNEIENAYAQLLIIKGEPGSGKTSIIASFLNQQHHNIGILYHFVGASQKRETPELILRDLIYQVCSCLNIEEPKYSGDETKEDLCKLLTQFVQNANDEIIIVIDDLEAIECDMNSLMSVITWLPTRINGLKYIMSLSLNQVLFQKCPEWIQKEELSLDPLTPTECHIFSKDYLIKKYSKNIEGKYGDNNEILTSEFYGKPNKKFLHNMGMLKLFLDEVSMLDFGKDKYGLELVNQIEEKSKDRHVVLSLPFARIEKDIFGKEKAKAVRMLSFLTISDFGIYENDIVAICSNQNTLYTQVDWSKLFCHIKPFVISDGYVRLSKEIKTTLYSRYLREKEKQDALRIELAERLEPLNTDNQYTQEIIRQYVKARDYSSLKRVLSSPQLITYVYRENNDILFDALKLLKSCNLTNDLAEDLMRAINEFDNEEQLSLYEVLSDVFSETLPIYRVAIDAISRAIAIHESEHHLSYEELKRLANNYIKLTRLLTTIYKFEDALKYYGDFFVLLNKNKELSSDTSLYVKGLIAQIRIYTHHPSIKEKQKAIPLYREAIEKSDKRNVVEHVSLLHNYIMFCGTYLHNKDEVAHYSQKMHSYIMDNTISGTLSYYKALLFYMEVGILEMELLEKDIDDYNELLKDSVDAFQEYIKLYGKLTRDTAAFYCIIGDIYNRIGQIYYRQNKYNDYVLNNDRAVHYSELYAKSVERLFEKDTKIYAISLHELARGYQSFIETRPMEREMIVQKCLSWYSEEENILKQLFPEGCWELAKLYHNKSFIYKEMKDLDRAKVYIEKAINIKRKYIDENEKSLHDSYIREIIIYKTEIVEKDIYDSQSLYKIQKKISELLTITKESLELPEQSKELRIQEIMKYQTWLDNWQNNKEKCYMEHAKDLFEVVKKMITDFQVRKKANKEDLPKLIMPLHIQWTKLNSYISKYHLETEFDNNAEYNQFKPLLNMIQGQFDVTDTTDVSPIK